MEWSLRKALRQEGHRPVSPQVQLDFLHAIRSIDLAWATAKLIMIDETINSEGPTTDLYKLIEQFRHNLKVVETLVPESAKAPDGSNPSNVFSTSHHENSGSGACKNRVNRPAPEGWVYKKEFLIRSTKHCPFLPRKKFEN
ncbi:hypothetical protein OnM2_040015 [Erysiphe neolycopersici]|uniref:Uncharacterized protein n=1 Tax=Erysiphe neolycopersici TaxID=212602 RepID=A0A420HVY4_9PEZI|nr:hypothetical protein OnM2_040015 [Erysiphe neolycopersici]